VSAKHNAILGIPSRIENKIVVVALVLDRMTMMRDIRMIVPHQLETVKLDDKEDCEAGAAGRRGRTRKAES
jgi:hypothetical protein